MTRAQETLEPGGPRMTTRRSIHTIVCLAALCSSACGCGAVQIGEDSTRAYPNQECVETALQRDPDRGALHDASAHFSERCRGGNAGACSTLGVMHELGLGVQQSDKTAAALYRRACEGGNAPGCVHLARAHADARGVMRARPRLPAGAPVRDISLAAMTSTHHALEKEPR